MFSVYSFGSYRVDNHTNPQTNKQTPLKTPNALRYATTLGKNPSWIQRRAACPESTWRESKTASNCTWRESNHATEDSTSVCEHRAERRENRRLSRLSFSVSTMILCLFGNAMMTSSNSGCRTSTQEVETFGNISSPFCTSVILWPPCKILRKSSQENIFRRGSKIERCHVRVSHLLVSFLYCVMYKYNSSHVLHYLLPDRCNSPHVDLILKTPTPTRSHFTTQNRTFVRMYFLNPDAF